MREQLVTQITLGVISGDLRVGDRLPSTREIARRFKIHSNTVSAAYQKLVEEKCLEYRKGSGFYVRKIELINSDDAKSLDRHIAEFFQNLKNLGFSVDEIKLRLREWSAVSPSPERVVVVESDEDLREILIQEIQTTISLPVAGISSADFEREHQKLRAAFVMMIDEKPKAEKFIAADQTRIYLRARSVPDSMTGKKRPADTDLIAVVSGWEKFLVWAKTILIAAEIAPESLIVRLTKEKGWQNGLGAASMIICDSVTAKKIADRRRTQVFFVISDESLREISDLLEPNNSALI